MTWILQQVPITVVLPSGKVGEGCYFINSTGSVSVDRPIAFRPQVGDTIAGVADQLYITSPYTFVKIWCTKKKVRSQHGIIL
ncbi:baseplate wedge tail fiber connector [Klebsiella phage CPRSB]|nr:baseplate wedge tail fiber connector [Klebsiella phage CPRSB]